MTARSFLGVQIQYHLEAKLMLYITLVGKNFDNFITVQVSLHLCMTVR